MKKTYKETRPAAVSSGITCCECQEEVEWITYLEGGDKVGVCGCPWTSWITDKNQVFRSTTNIL